MTLPTPSQLRLPSLYPGSHFSQSLSDFDLLIIPTSWIIHIFSLAPSFQVLTMLNSSSYFRNPTFPSHTSTSLFPLIVQINESIIDTLVLLPYSPLFPPRPTIIWFWGHCTTKTALPVIKLSTLNPMNTSQSFPYLLAWQHVILLTISSVLKNFLLT